MTGLERADSGSVVVAGEDLQQAQRGRARALPRQKYRHRLPGLPPHSDHDGAGKRRGAARTCRRTRRFCARRARAGGGRLGGASASLSDRTLRRRAAARRDRPGAGAQSGHRRRRRTDRQSRRSDRRRDHRASVPRPSRARHARWCSSPTIPRWPPVAIACCTCIRDGSPTPPPRPSPREHGRSKWQRTNERRWRCAFAWRELRGGLARLRRFHRLHRAWRHGDRRRRLGGAKPRRRLVAAPAA